MRPSRSLLLTIALASCAPAASSAGSQRSSPLPSASPAPSTIAPASQAPGTSAPATSASAAPTSPKLPEEEIPFVLAAQGRAPVMAGSSIPDVRLHALPGALFLHAGARLAQLGPSGFAPASAVEKTLPHGFGVQRIFGLWPKSAFAELHALQGDPASALYRLNERGASRLHPIPADSSYEGAWYGPDGRVGGVVYTSTSESIATTIALLEGPKGPLPELTRRSDGEPRMGLYTVASFPSGHLIFFGIDRADATGQYLAVIERWEPGATRGTFERPPMPPSANGHLEHAAMGAGSPSQVWIAGMASGAPGQPERPYLARWDGARWSLLDVPASSSAPHGAPNVAVSADGELWIGWENAGPGEILHRKQDGRWSRASLPEPPAGFPPGPRRLMDLLAYEGELWIVTTDQSAPARFAVHRTHPSQGVLEIDALKP